MFDNMKQCASMGHTKRNHSLWRLTWCENSQIEISNRFHRQNQIKQSGNGIDFYTKNHIVLENPKIYNTWIYTNGTTNLYNGFIYADYYQYWGLYLFGFNQCEIC